MSALTTEDRKMQPGDRRLQLRRARSSLMVGLVWLAAMIAVIPLLAVLVWIFVQGLPALNLDFFTKIPGPPDDPHQGVANAIGGTVELLGIAALISVPVGVGAGIYISEFGGSKYNTLLRFATDVLSGVPSITIGVFVYALIVLPTKQFSALAGGVALALVMLPILIRTTEEMLRLVPGSIREAALALGAPVWRTILRYALPAALPGIVTGGLLAMARAAGETAPLLFTALGNNQWNTSLTGPIDALTLKVYFYAGQAYDIWRQESWAGAVVLTLMVLITSILARIATRSRNAR
ncbi:MAG: phosphate ABC transporter permease PstA [Chloroflexia bacterium]